MSTTAETGQTTQAEPAAMPAWLILLLAVAGGTLVANLYYSPPLVGPIAAARHAAARLSWVHVSLAGRG